MCIRDRRSFLLAPKTVQLLFCLFQPCWKPGKSIVQTLDITRSTGSDGYPVGHLAFQQHLILFLETVKCQLQDVYKRQSYQRGPTA